MSGGKLFPLDLDPWDEITEGIATPVESLNYAESTVVEPTESSKMRLKHEQRRDKDLQQAVLECQKAPNVKCEPHELGDDGLLYVRDSRRLRLAIPKSMVEEVIGLYHDGPLGAHRRRDQTYAVLRNRFEWPRMYEDVANWVGSCIRCNRS